MADEETEPLIGKKETSSTDWKLTTWRRFLIGPVLFLYMMGYIMSYYIITEYTNHVWLERNLKAANMSRLLDNTTCYRNTSSLAYKVESRSTESASKWVVYYSLAQGIPAIFANVILGSYSDALGRKFLLTIGTLGTTVRLCASVVIIRYNASLLFFLLACALEGCTGQFATILTMSLAYICDITKIGRQRILGILFIEIVIGSSIIAASALAGYLIDIFGYLVSISFAAAALAASLAITLLILPESFPVAKRKNHKSIKHLVKDSLVFYTRNDGENRRWKYQVLGLAYAVCNLTFLSRVPTETLYEMAPPYCWSAHKVGIYASVRTLCMVFVGFGFVKLFRMFLTDVSTSMVGALSYGAAFLVMAFATGDVMFYISLALNVFGPLHSVMVRNIASSLADPTEQGALFASLGAIEIACNLLSSAITGGVYAATVSMMRGFVFLVLAGLDVVSALLLLLLNIFWKRERRRDKKLLQVN